MIPLLPAVAPIVDIPNVRLKGRILLIIIYRGIKL